MSTSVSLHVRAAGFVSACFVILGTASAAVGPPECSRLIDGMFYTGKQYVGPPTIDHAVEFLSPDQAAGCLWKAAYPPEPLPPIPQATRAAVKAAAQKSATAQQTGAQTGSSGTTSAITQPGTPFSLATEYGGITSSTSNQTVTFQIPLDGIPRALTKDGTLTYCSTTLISIPGCIRRSTLDILNRFGLSVSFNTSTPANSVKATATGPAQGTTQQVTATSQSGSTPSFSGASIKYTIRRAPWKLTAFSGGTNAAGSAEALNARKLVLLLQGSRYTEWQQCVAEKLHAAANREAADDIYRRYFTQLKDILQSGTEVSGCDAVPAGSPKPIDPTMLREYLGQVVQDAELTEANVDADIMAALASPILTFETDFSTPQNQSDYLTFKFVGSKSWGGANAKTSNNLPPSFTLTLNAGVSIYDHTPTSSVPGTTLLRSAQAGAEFDYVVPTSRLLKKLGDSTAALAYYYQDQTSPSVLSVTPGSPLPGITLVGLPSNAMTIFTENGHINVGQFKYGLGTGKNVKFPIAVTYSSRTELIAHHTWGAQFGVSYDFTSLIPNSGTSSGTQSKGAQ